MDDLHNKYDIIGTVYELHLKTGTSNSLRDLGQYFTNRQIIDFMIELNNPQMINGKIETILDPSCGTGGFLTKSIQYLNKKYQNINWNENKKNIYGFDIDEHVKNLCMLNILLETGQIFNKTISQTNTLNQGYYLEPINEVIEKVDIILANEPFGLKGLKYENCNSKIKNLNIKGTKAEPLFLQLMMTSLNENGRCAVIVPDGVLFNESNLHTNTRKYLIENLNVVKIIKLCDKLFLNTGVCSSIIFFEKKEKTTFVEFTEIYLQNNKIIEKDILKINYDTIVEKKYVLWVNKYLKNPINYIENIKYEKISELCKFYKKSKRHASFGKNTGQYVFYSSSNNIKHCDIADYENEIIIIGTGGIANIKIDTNFSCSSDNFLLSSKCECVYTKYIYYYLLSNIKLLENCFKGSTIKHLSKNDLLNIEIPIINITQQQKIIENFINTEMENNKLSKKIIENEKNALEFFNDNII